MRFGLVYRAFAASTLALACADASPAPAQDAPPQALRLCADPTNLPFSSNDPAQPGVYNEIGEAIGKALGRPVAYVWYRTYFGKRAVRVTMLAKECDATIGLPASEDFMGPRVIFSKPMFNLDYAIVAPKGHTFAGVEDLKGKKVAVQFETEPQNLVGPRDDMTAVTVLSPEEGMKALAEGRADAAFLWAPSAGYLNKTAYAGRFAIVPVGGPRLTFATAIGFAKRSSALREFDRRGAARGVETVPHNPREIRDRRGRFGADGSRRPPTARRRLRRRRWRSRRRPPLRPPPSPLPPQRRFRRALPKPPPATPESPPATEPASSTSRRSRRRRRPTSLLKARRSSTASALTATDPMRFRARGGSTCAG